MVYYTAAMTPAELSFFFFLNDPPPPKLSPLPHPAPLPSSPRFPQPPARPPRPPPPVAAAGGARDRPNGEDPVPRIVRKGAGELPRRVPDAVRRRRMRRP